MNLSLLDLPDNDSRTGSDSPSLGNRTPTPSPGPSYWPDPRYSSSQAAELQSALAGLPKSFSSQLSQYAQYSSLQQYAGYGLAAQTPSFQQPIKDRGAGRFQEPARDRERELLAASRAYESLGSLYGQAALPGLPGSSNSSSANGPAQSSKYTQLLAVIEEIGKDIRPTYAGSKSSAERLKRGIVHARILVREALMEAERSGRQ